MRSCIVGINLNCGLEHLPCRFDSALYEVTCVEIGHSPHSASPQHMVVSRWALSRAFLRCADIDAFHAAGSSRGDHPSNFILNCKNVLLFAIVVLCPNVIASGRIDKLRRHAEPLARSANASLYYVLSAQLSAYVPDIDGTIPKLEG